MGEFFVRIYLFFQKKRVLFYSLIFITTLIFGLLASRLRLQEDITSFFPDNDKDDARSAMVFKNLKIKDRIVVMVTCADSLSTDPDQLIEYAGMFVDEFSQRADSFIVKSVMSVFEEENITRTIGFIYDYLPVYMDDSHYNRIDSLLQHGGMEQLMRNNYSNLISPMGMAIRDVVLKDPFCIGSDMLSKLNIFNQFSDYTIYDQHIFSADMNTLLVFIEPAVNSSASSENEILVSAIEDSFTKIESQSSGQARFLYYGGAGMAVYNARQIKSDTMLTVTIALIIIMVFIVLAFRRVKTLALIVMPVIFGSIFALGLVYILKGQISAIAVGGAAAIMGIALSHSIHIISHSYHSKDASQIIRELAYPLTVGSFTTIGAFLGLLFTSSPLLRDFGLFSALLLIGTTLYSLIVLPHFLFFPPEGYTNRFLRSIESVTSYTYDRNRYIITGLTVIFFISLFYFNDVRFNSDMMKLSYVPEHLGEAERKLEEISGSTMKSILLISSAGDTDSAIVSYKNVLKMMREAGEEGLIEGIVSASDFILPMSVQQERIQRWNDYWTAEKRATVVSAIEKSARECGFNSGAFAPFSELLDNRFTPLDINSEVASLAPAFSEWIDRDGSWPMLISQVRIDESNKEEVYKLLDNDPTVSIVDRSYYIGKMAKAVNDDFYTVLWISSLLIFAALLISYGRIELALLAFIPMSLSWVIILGLMSLLGIEFNIVNIILSTFIFGIGDDFSIFIMDGLLAEYRTGKKILGVHKTAIFFSVVTIIAGMGALVFAVHPAMRSLAWISLLGILSVVFISYVVQPVIFRAFVSMHASKGNHPYTLRSLLNTIYCFTFFVLGCLFLNLYILMLRIVPAAKSTKQRSLLMALSLFVRAFLKCMITVKIHRFDIRKEEFATPSVIIANHESFIDLLVMLGLNPKMLIMTNSWVWNSPFFGQIVRYAGFLHSAEGPEAMIRQVEQKKKEGYSILVFPEGTRSESHDIKRFHKGAFHLASELQMDILPVVLYGNGLISSCKQPFYIKTGEIALRMLPRVKAGDDKFGVTLREQARNYRSYFISEYEALGLLVNRSRNGYFYDTLIKNYTYKGPVLEWYMRIKVMMENQYRFFDSLIPRDASIVDVGCGYGPLSLMLSMMSAQRRIIGLDYDEEKIEVAGKCFSANHNTTFVCADAVSYDYPHSDVFILNDMLHYLDAGSQQKLITTCAERLNDKGLIIIRDGDSENSGRHAMTELTETWSTRIIGFNKTAGELTFLSSTGIKSLAEKLNLEVKQIENDRFTSNTIYLLTSKKQIQ